MSHKESLREEIIRWNNQYPLDRIYRKKYNIAFGSKEHRAMCQIDVYLDWLEDSEYKEYEEEMKLSETKRKEYESGKWLGDIPVSDEDSFDLFDKLDVTNIPSSLQIED